MFKYLLQSVDGIHLWGIAALLLFFGVFCAAFLRVLVSKKSYWEAQAHIPFEDDQLTENTATRS